MFNWYMYHSLTDTLHFLCPFISHLIPLSKSLFLSLSLFCLSLLLSVSLRLGYTYLRLKDSHMEILNKDDEIER